MTNNTIWAILLFISYIAFMLTTKQDINEIDRDIQYLSGSIADTQVQLDRRDINYDGRFSDITSNIEKINKKDEEQQRYIDSLVEETDTNSSVAELFGISKCWTWNTIPVLLRYVYWSNDLPLPKWYRYYAWSSTIGTVKVLEKSWMVWHVGCYSLSELVEAK